MSSPTPPPSPRTPELRRPRLKRVAQGLLLALPLSSLLHALWGLVFFALTARSGCMPVFGGTGQDGENGAGGSGGRTVDITVEGEVTGQIGPRVAGQPEPPRAPAPEPPPPTREPEPQPQPAPPRARARVLAARPEPARNEPAESPAQNAPGETNASASEQRPASPSNTARQAQGGGTGHAVTNGGLRPGSIGEQRALLPQAVRCGDPVAGIWRAHKYDPLWGDWFRVTLRIERERENQLRGVIVARMWDGGPMDRRPPACGPAGFDFTVEQRAYGQQRGWYVEFGANSYTLREMHCNSAFRRLQYNPDHFSGTIDPQIQEFQSVNNDGGRAVNDPMVFRRIRCLSGDDAESDAQDPGAPSPDTAPPGNPLDTIPLPELRRRLDPAREPDPPNGGADAGPRAPSPWNTLPWRPPGAAR